ncbi:molecular chaperone DjiA [Maricaulis sp.]|uniref:molecular chaperone DjiA n=1 Tax=unclassified Maricaulis TaxID=2632371 RepID=UPI001AFE619B|nr:molecular chaperone DjiA [Maricaulis sp.]MBO6796669.1 molecular chaperone DjiA [Maricaulis sp.]
MGFWRKLAARLKGKDCFLACDGCDDPNDRTVGDADFAMALIGLGAKMAKADGVVSRSEIRAFYEVFRPPPEGREPLDRAFELAMQTTLGFEGYARRLARRFRSNPAMLEDVIDGLFHIAKADGAVTSSEERFLEDVAGIFGFNAREFRRIRMGHLGAPDDDPYVILGIEADIADADLKRAYRRIASQNHPDRMIARGAPPEAQRLAGEKMAVINLAYDQILKERGLIVGLSN